MTSAALIFHNQPMGSPRKVLQYNQILELLPLRQRNALYAKSKYLDVKREDYVYRRKDKGDYMIGVMSGRLRLSLSSPEGKEILLTMIDRGEMVGEMSMIDGLPRATDLIADVDSTLIILQRDDFLPVLMSCPEAMLRMMRTDCDRRRRYMHMIELLSLQSAPTKVARYILRLARDYGIAKEDGSVHIEARLSQIDMAHQLACSRESVNKQLAALVERGSLTLDGDVIILNDLEAFKRIVKATKRKA